MRGEQRLADLRKHQLMPRVTHRLYYQSKVELLPACTLPIHGLLHIAEGIRQCGPVWCYWEYPMERFCGALLPSIKSRKHPFISLNHRVRDIAQLDLIKTRFNLAEVLALKTRKDVASLPTGQPLHNCMSQLLPGL